MPANNGHNATWIHAERKQMDMFFIFPEVRIPLSLRESKSRLKKMRFAKVKECLIIVKSLPLSKSECNVQWLMYSVNCGACGRVLT